MHVLTRQCYHARAPLAGGLVIRYSGMARGVLKQFGSYKTMVNTVAAWNFLGGAVIIWVRMSHELRERWYSTRKFRLDGSDGSSIPKLFLEDVLGKDLNPGALVRHIHMESRKIHTTCGRMKTSS